MAENEQINSEETQGLEPQGTVDNGYRQLASREPEREVELPSEEVMPAGEKGKSLALAMRTANLTDMQSAQLRLCPDDLGDKVTKHLQVARISPDAFQAIVHMLTKNDIANADPNEPIDVPTLLVKNHILVSIGLDSEGRIDLLELAGAAKAEEERKKTEGFGLK